MYHRYPLAMSHPQQKPAVISQDQWVNGHVVKAPPGKPAQFPPVFVNNADQESQYASMGYLPNGTPDPEAYLRQTIGSVVPTGPEFHEYPKCLYQYDGNDVKSRIVNSAADEKKLGSGWYANPGLAMSAVEDDEDSDDEDQDDDDKSQPEPAQNVHPETVETPVVEVKEAPKRRGRPPKEVTNGND